MRPAFKLQVYLHPIDVYLNSRKMNINVHPCAVHLRKTIFAIKSFRKDGLLLQFHYTSSRNNKERSTRFTQTCFNYLGQILVAATHRGDLFVINFAQSKFWFLTNISSCSVLEFSSQNENEIIAGVNDGLVYIINIQRSEIIDKLLGHSHPVSDVSFSNDSLCITASTNEAIVWNLQSSSKIQVLTLSQNTMLKHVIFMPVTSNILACFHDDSIHVWKYGTFEPLHQIFPASWNKFLVRCMAFTRNGRVMVLGGHSSSIQVFLVDTWTIIKTITLSDHLQGVKKLDFISQPFDGGSNKILSILATNGAVYFYDMQLDNLINKLSVDVEIIKSNFSPDGKLMTCILTSGTVNVYSLSQFITVTDGDSQDSVTDGKAKLHIHQGKKSTSKISMIHDKMKGMLDVQKLQAILKEFGQYPDTYRLKIWTQLLNLPNNQNEYNARINHLSRISFEDLEKRYPMVDRITFKNLKKVLANLVTWCSFFADVEFLPLFSFPFVKVFKNEPVLCFEAVCSIIVNWCQHWFEYYPLPPINTLAMIENILFEHNPLLLSHLTKNNVTSKIYAWPLLETIFSEVLTVHDWLILWDHILSNEPSYLLMVVVAYNAMYHTSLVKLKEITDFEYFYHHQKPIDVKKLTSRANNLLNSTSSKNHPRQYVNYYKQLEFGTYPNFVDYPHAVVDYKDHANDLKKTSRLLEFNERNILKERCSKLDSYVEIKRNLEQNIRLEELDELYREKISSERELVEKQRERLERLRTRVHEEEMEILKVSKDALVRKCQRDDRASLIYALEQKGPIRDANVSKVANDLVRHYLELIKHKRQIEKMLNCDRDRLDANEDEAVLQEQQKFLDEEIEKVQSVTDSKNYLKQLNVATGLIAMDDLIKKVEVQLKMQGKNETTQPSTNTKQLELETIQLEMEVKQLLHLLDRLKGTLSKPELNDYRLLKGVGKEVKNGYQGRPTTPIK